MQQIVLDGIAHDCVHVPTAHTHILLVKAAGGFLACGYFDLAVANRVGDAAAIVTGVKTIDQMLDAAVVRASERALAAGVTLGQSGREALRALRSAERQGSDNAAISATESSRE
jgi:uncharacterized protein YunC (DUF1805 family)